MDKLYEFLSGPGLWIAFIVFGLGLIIRLTVLLSISREKDKPFWDHREAGWALRSIFHWLVPWASVSTRSQPFFAAVVFIFHLCWIGVPLLLQAHNMLFEEAFGWSLPTLPEGLAEILTLVVIGCGVFFIVRRLVRAEVRILTSAWDWFLLLLALSPFVTGWLAFRQYGPYDLMLNLHILLSEVLLVIIPFSKLAHVVLFFFSRTAIGFEFGTRRGARAW